MWKILLTSEFEEWFANLNDIQKTDLIASLALLREFGPMLKRPHSDSIKGSRINNLKELRTQSQGQPLRSFYCFDKNQIGIVFCGGNKKGKDKIFYNQMIHLAEKLHDQYIDTL